MPTPIGHALGGITAGYVVATFVTAKSAARAVRVVPAGLVNPVCGLGTLACVGMLADVDLLFGLHRGLTHSLAAALFVGLLYACTRYQQRVLAGLTVSAAYGSHVLFDWIGVDSGPPLGVEVFWPLSEQYYQAEFLLFFRICRDYADPDCWSHNAMALGWELIILVPLTGAVVWMHRVYVQRRSTG